MGRSYLDIARLDCASIRDYYDALRGLAGGAAAFFDASLGGLIVTAFADCVDVLTGADFTKSDMRDRPANDASELDAVMQSHFAAATVNTAAARRRYWARRVSTTSVDALERLACDLLSQMKDTPFDLNRDVLRPYVLRAALLVSGIRVEPSDVAASLDVYVGHLDGRLDGGTPFEIYQAYIRLLTVLTVAEPYDGEKFRAHGYHAPQEWVVDMAFVLAAAQESTAFLVGSILAAAQRSDVDLARYDADLVLQEGLRFDSPVQLVGRYAGRDTLVAGTSVAAGTRVFCHIGLANRDPARFSDPERYDPGRSEARDALAFGAGRWACIGQGLARTQARIMLGALRARGATLSIGGLRYEHATAAREFRALPCALARPHQ